METKQWVDLWVGVLGSGVEKFFTHLQYALFNWFILVYGLGLDWVFDLLNYFDVGLQRYMQQHNEVELSALGMGIF